jgi:hypothetical protein
MANANAPFGLKPVRSASSAPFNDGCDPFALLAADTNAYYIGDPVVLSGTADTDGTPSATLATAGAGNRITGAISGFGITPSVIATGHRVAGDLVHAFVEHDPDLLYEVQANGPVAATDIGANANLIAGASPDGRRSGWMLDTASMTTTATLQVRIMGLARRPDNDFGANAVVLVRINQTTETPAAGSTGL